MKRCFTLVEILVAAAILVVLMGIGLGVVSYVSKKTEMTEAETGIRLIEHALERYKKKYGGYPKSDDDVFKFKKTHNIWKCFEEVEEDGSGNIKSIRGLRIAEDGSDYKLIDPCNEDDAPFVYRSPGKFNRGKFDLGSRGHDSNYGDDKDDYDNFGEGDDITNFKR